MKYGNRISGHFVQGHVDTTAKLKKIKGKNLTPYLLKEISKLSNEKTLRANTSLIINNAKLAAKIAAKLNIMLWK